MKNLILYFSILFLGIISCKNNDEDCTNTIRNTTSLESEYGCSNTKHQMEIELADTYKIIRTQADFTEFVSGSCQPTIDFSIYDLVIGKKALSHGNSSIDYKLIENCETGNNTLSVTFNQNETLNTPNITYHALIPKLKNNQELNVEIVFN